MYLSQSDLRQFETELDAALDSLRCWSFSGPDTLYLIGDIIETCYARGETALVSHFEYGLSVLAPRLVLKSIGDEPTAEGLFEALHFAGHYYALRDYLYYSYNAPSSCQWTFETDRVAVRFADRTIPRQYWLKYINYVMLSRSVFADSSRSERIVAMLRGVSEFEASAAVAAALDLIEEEAADKLQAYFLVIPASSTVSLGRYRYCDYYIAVRLLLAKALYHRYHALANGSIGTVHVSKLELTEALCQDAGLSIDTARAILQDIIYGEESSRAGIQPMGGGIYDLPGRDQILMLPHTFSMQDNLVDILRVVAKRDPAEFQRSVAPVLDQGFGTLIQQIFTQHGFQCYERLSLSKFDRSLPDIDLLVVSTEPTLGYFIYVCELKGMIPAQWSKDYIRGLSEGSLPKAFEQVRRVLKFLGSREGARFLRNLLPAEGLPHFGQKFIVALKGLVITSDNAGMLFAGKDCDIIDYRTLSRIVERSDGDVTYINFFLSELGKFLDDAVRTVSVQCLVGERLVEYEGVSVGQLIDFPEHKYRSVGLDREIAKAFIEAGYHPFEVFDHRDGPNGRTDLE